MSEIKSTKTTQEQEIDLLDLCYAILNNYKLVAAVTALLTVLGVVYALLATPIYRADALVQVESKLGSTALSDLSDMFAESQSKSAKEIEIIKSRLVTGQAVKTLMLDIGVKEQRGWWANLFGGTENAVKVAKFEVPSQLEGKAFTLKFNGQNYTLTHDGEVVLTGKVAEMATNGGVTLLVDKLVGAKDSEFTITKSNTLLVINQLIQSLSVKDRGKDTGVLELTYANKDPELAQQVLQAITQNYLLQNVERTSEQVSKSLEFLTVQIPQVAAQLNAAETRLNEFRKNNKTFDLTAEAQAVLDTIVRIEEQQNQLSLKEAEISKNFTPAHPEYKSLLKQKALLAQEKKLITGKIASLPKSQQTLLELQRDAKTNEAIYLQLLNRQQEMKIAKASAIGNVRIIDEAATAPKPIKPRKKMVVALAFMLGLLGSCGWVVLKQILRNKLESVNQIEELGLQTYVAVPQSLWQKSHSIITRKSRFGKADAKSYRLLAAENPTDLAIESLRSLRTSLYFAVVEAKNKVVLISGCAPGAGKSFITANLALICAQAGQKVLIVDGDMRRGYLHRIFKGQKRVGLADYLLGKNTKADIIEVTKENANLAFISCGHRPSNPSELLMHPRFGQLIAELKEEFDLILLDSAPILSVTDPLIMAKQVGTTLLVVRYGETSADELLEATKRFEKNNIKVSGVVLNNVKQERNRYYQYGYHYGSSKL